MKLLAWVIALLVATSGVAEAAPVAGAIAAVSSWTVTIGATQFAVGAFLVNTVSSIALSALSMALRGKPKIEQPGITTNTTTAGGVVPQRLVFGRYATGGQHVCPPMVYQTDGNPNEWLVYVISLADKPITALRQIIVNGKKMSLDGDPAAALHGDLMGATVIDSGDKSLRNKVYVRFHDGRQTAADPYLMRVFSTYPERPWQADMIGTGVAYAVVTFKGKSQDGDYQGFPQVKFEVDGHALYDPRDTAQNEADEATWKFTRNPAVIAYNILRGIDIPGGDRWGVGARKFLLSYLLAAANVCDASVPVEGGGTRVRYQAGLEVGVDTEPHQALTEVLKAMGGDVADMGGTWIVRAGPPAGPVLSITDDDIIVTDTRSLRPYPGLAETVNAIHASYPDPDQQWEAKEAVPLYDPALEVKDGGRRLIADVSFPAVTDPRQVRALMREMLADHRRHRTHVITLPPDAAGLCLGDHIAWSSVTNGYRGKLFKVAQMMIDPVSLCVAVTLIERDPADYDYDAGSDAKVPTIPSPAPVAPIISGITKWDVQPVNAGGRPGIRMTWDADVGADAIAWVIRLASDGSVVNRGSTADLRAGEVVITAGLRPSTAYLVTGRLILRRDTAWTQEVTVTTLALGLTWEDLTGEVRDSVEELEEWADGTGPYLRDIRDEIGSVRDGLLETDLGSFTQREEIRRNITAEVGAARAQFDERIEVAARETEAVARRVTSLSVSVGENASGIRREQIARADADRALALDIQKVAATAGENAASITEERLARVAADEALAASIETVEASLGDKAEASAVQALVARVSETEQGLEAQSDAITQVEAKTDRGTAGGLLRVTSQSGPTGVLARAVISVAATADGPTTEGALYLDAKAGGISQLLARVDRMAWVTGPSGAPQFPLIADDGIIYINDARVRTLSVGGNAITAASFVSGQTNDLTLTYVLDGPSGETYQVFILGSSTISVTAWLRLYVNGIERWAEQPIGGALAARPIVIGLQPGTHTIRLWNENPANSNNASLYVLATKR